MTDMSGVDNTSLHLFTRFLREVSIAWFYEMIGLFRQRLVRHTMHKPHRAPREAMSFCPSFYSAPVGSGPGETRYPEVFLTPVLCTLLCTLLCPGLFLYFQLGRDLRPCTPTLPAAKALPVPSQSMLPPPYASQLLTLENTIRLFRDVLHQLIGLKTSSRFLKSPLRP